MTKVWFFDDSNSWFENSKRLNMIWRLVKDLDPPEIWSYGHLKDPKIENEASKNIVLSSFCPYTKIAGRHEQVSNDHEQSRLIFSISLRVKKILELILKLSKLAFLHCHKIARSIVSCKSKLSSSLNNHKIFECVIVNSYSKWAQSSLPAIRTYA